MWGGASFECFYKLRGISKPSGCHARVRREVAVGEGQRDRQMERADDGDPVR